eukprot:763559-Hanusia_phi.AAC.2
MLKNPLVPPSLLLVAFLLPPLSPLVSFSLPFNTRTAYCISQVKGGNGSSTASWVDATGVEILISLGFDKEMSRVALALEACEGDVQRARPHLLRQDEAGWEEKEGMEEEAEEEAQALASIFGENFVVQDDEWR